MWTNTEAIAGKQNKENDAANVGTTLVTEILKLCLKLLLIANLF